ncbi:MAG: tetratricopeptide repeat protein [Candidatus Berkiellales bacterium]
MSKSVITFFLFFAILTLTGCMSEINRSLTRLEAKESYYAGDVGRSFRLTEAMAYQGDMKAEYTLGYLYFYGIGAPQNKQLGVAWILQSAEKGYPPAVAAMDRLSGPYLDGYVPNRLVAKKPAFHMAKRKPQETRTIISQKEAEKAKQLALQGDLNAQYMLGYMYYYGKGTELNKTLGVSLIKQAALKGHDSAIIALKRLDILNVDIQTPQQASQSFDIAKNKLIENFHQSLDINLHHDFIALLTPQEEPSVPFSLFKDLSLNQMNGTSVINNILIPQLA